MSAAALVVVLDGREAGVLEVVRGSRLRFTYRPGHRERRDATPLSLSMPVSSREHPHEVLWPFLWGLLPDNDAVLARWGREFQVSPANPFALLTHVGEDCAGAVQFLTPDRFAQLYDDAVDAGDGSAADGNVEWLTEEQVGDRLRALRTDPTAWHFTAQDGQFSLAGAQPKVALLHDGRRWGRPSGATPTTHILKPAITGLADHDLNEHLCLRLAGRLGLRAATSELATFNDERTIVLTRYDRILTRGRWRRIHQEDMCQALGVHPAGKYQHDGGPSPAAIVDLLRRTHGSEAPAAVLRFLEALAFNWLIAGSDAHAKNYSLLLAGRQVRLAPLYDVASTLPYDRINQQKVKLAMKVGSAYRVQDIVGRHWVRLAGDVGVDPGMLLERVAELARRAPGELQTLCADPVVADLGSSLPEVFAERLTMRCETVRHYLN